METLQRHKLSLRYAVDTHFHADHLSGPCHLAQMAGAEVVIYHSSPVIMPFLPLDDGAHLNFGNAGHRNGTLQGIRQSLSVYW